MSDDNSGQNLVMERTLEASAGPDLEDVDRP